MLNMNVQDKAGACWHSGSYKQTNVWSWTNVFAQSVCISRCYFVSVDSAYLWTKKGIFTYNKV